ncbi:hypothetical protein JCM17960_08660 [Magnetospira thiophila]
METNNTNNPKETTAPFKSIDKLMHNIIKSSAIAFDSKSENSGFLSGINSLDKVLHGFRKSDFIVIAGQSHESHSVLAYQVGLKAAQEHQGEKYNKEGAEVAIFSLAKNADSVLRRFIALQSGVSEFRYRDGNVSAIEYNQALQAAYSIQNLPIFINDAPNLSVHDLCAQARNMKKDRDIGLIIIDHLDRLIANNCANITSKDRETHFVACELKALAIDLNCAVLSLFNTTTTLGAMCNECSKKENEENITHLIDTADVLLVFHSAYEHYKHSGPTQDSLNMRYERWHNGLQSFDGIIEVDIIKNKHGQIGGIDVMSKTGMGLHDFNPFSPDGTAY